MKVVIWGTGHDAKALFEYLNMHIFNPNCIVAVCDSNNQGRDFYGYSVIEPVEIQDLDFDYIVIASSSYFNEIREQILSLQLCSKREIIDIDYFERMVYSQECYYKRYQRFSYNSTGNESAYNRFHDKTYIGDNSKIIVYTAITGSYDLLKEPEFSDDDIKYICFTNNCSLSSNLWDIRYTEDKSLSNVMLARNIKLCPWLYMECNGIIVWVDGKYQIKDDLREYVGRYMKNKPLLFFPHFCRNTVIDEMAELIRWKKDIRRDLIIQTSDYLRSGFDDNRGLYDTGCFIRNFNDEFVKKLMSEWWQEIQTYTYRDQISFPYVCWKNNYLPEISDLYIEKNRWLECMEHTKLKGDGA